MLAYLLPKNISDFIFFFFQNTEFGEYFCKMPPKKRIKRRGSQEMERMSTQVQARSPEIDELTCVPETQQSQQAAGVEELVVRVVDPVEMSQSRVRLGWRHSRIRIQVMRTLLTHRTHMPLGGHRRARAKRLTKGARKPLLCSVMRMSRNYWTFYVTMEFSTTSV